MAWNEPGGGRDRDPWGGGGDQGPPDLDEALKKLQQRLGGLFGGRGGGQRGGGGSGASLSGPLLALVLASVVVVWALFGFYQVDQAERAVVLRFGVYHSTVDPGLHWNPPLIDRVSKVNTTQVRTVSHKALMLTEDENIVSVGISVQYRVTDPVSFLLRVRQPEHSLEQAMESALRHVVGGAVMDLVITEGREQIAVDVQGRLQSYLNTYETGITVSRVNIDDSHPPQQVVDAFDDVTRAKEDKVRLQNEAEAYANSIVPEARGRAQRMIEEATGYREQVVARSQGQAERFAALYAEYSKEPEVTRQRLYLDAVQDVLSGTSKVMVSAEGNNNLLYLPLDQLARESGANRSKRRSGSESVRVELEEEDLRKVADQVLQQLQRSSGPVRGREGR